MALVFTFAPSEDRASSNISLKCKIDTAPVASIGGTVFITKEQGVRKAYANDTKQEPLFPQDPKQAEAAATA